ncbi:DUF3179 domain-containing protein [Candidatus Poribacteria bacterium]|nr:DUF3179 domain-containing protein [Candidatus Poribacteria bacterium]
MIKKSWIFLFIIAGLFIVSCINLNQSENDMVEEKEIEEAEGLVFNPIQVVPPYPAITEPPLITASQVEDQVNDNELVLGVSIDGQSRAYPINMLTGPSREIINDNLAGVAIAATW